jgi:hypothetical protein
MRRLLTWLGGLLGGIAAWRFVRRRGAEAHEVATAEPAGDVDPRAEALRAKLDAAREEAGEAPRDPPGAEGADPEARRRSVHEHGRAALEEMRGAEGVSEGDET